MLAALPALRRRRDDRPDPGPERRLPRPPASQGAPRPAKTVGRRHGARASRRAARCGTTSRASTTPTRDCRESALRFLSAWTTQLHGARLRLRRLLQRRLGHRDARRRPGRPAGDFAYPDQIWIARWDGVANTCTSYIREDGWRPGRRVKQYKGGHNETWGGVTINIDRNYLDARPGIGRAEAETHCGGVRINFARLQAARCRGNAQPSRVTRCSACSRSKACYAGKINGSYDAATIAGRQRVAASGFGATSSATWSDDNWVTLLAGRRPPVLKFGSAGSAVRRLQRALNAALGQPRVAITGVFGPATKRALRA